MNSTGAERRADIVLAAAVIAMGLLAGLIYAFSTAVMPGLTAVEDRTLVDAMQRMADNPVFPLTFLAAPALAIVAFFAIHIPLNEDLKQAGDPAGIGDLAAVHDDFVTPRVAWNIGRTLASAMAFGALAWARRPARTHGPSGMTQGIQRTAAVG